MLVLSPPRGRPRASLHAAVVARTAGKAATMPAGAAPLIEADLLETA